MDNKLLKWTYLTCHTTILCYTELTKQLYMYKNKYTGGSTLQRGIALYIM